MTDPRLLLPLTAPGQTVRSRPVAIVLPVRWTACFIACAFASSAYAFTVMRVEQVIGSLNGDAAAHAIQLQMRTANQGLVSNAKLWVCDATGANRVLLLDITTNVANSAAGARILLATPAFTSAMLATNPSFAPDFALAQAIPPSYLAAGRLTYEDDSGSAFTPGTIYWSVSWGGAAYTGPNTGSTQNDPDGNFGPPYPFALPTSGAMGIRLTSPASTLSTTNAADYSLTANPATVTRNDGISYTLPLLTPLEAWRQSYFGTTANSGDAANLFDYDKDGLVNIVEFAFGVDPRNFGTVGLPIITRDGQGRLVVQFVRRKSSTNAGVTYQVETGPTLDSLAALSLVGASVNSIDATFESVIVIDPPITPNRFGRIRVGGFFP